MVKKSDFIFFTVSENKVKIPIQTYNLPDPNGGTLKVVTLYIVNYHRWF